MDERRFKSRFGADGPITEAQYLAENMCDREARSKKVVLGSKFWRDKSWNRHFSLQLKHAKSLLKTYSVEAIIRALRTPEGKKTRSLGAPWLDPLIHQEQQKWEREQASLKAAQENPVTQANPSPATEAPRPVFVEKQSTLSKLRGL